MSADHKVQPRSEQSLAKWADEIRKRARTTSRYTIDIIDLIERLKKEIGFALVLAKDDKYGEPAFVKFRKAYPYVVLTVHRKIWEDAKNGSDYAYFVLAHEIAHIILHDHKAVAFTHDPSLHIRYAFSEYSAEWQADIFAKHLTMPDEALRDTRDPMLLSILCNVEEHIAAEKIRSYLRTGPMRELTYDGNPCSNCANYTLVHNGTDTRCETCGQTVKERAPPTAPLSVRRSRWPNQLAILESLGLLPTSSR